MVNKNEIDMIFEKVSCTGVVYASSLNSDKTFSLNGEVSQTPASIFKVPLVLALFHLANRGEVDLSKKFRIVGGKIPMQACGISQFKHPVDISLEDLAYMCLALSDAESTDIILDIVGTKRLNDFLVEWRMKNTYFTSSISQIIQDLSESMGFETWDNLVDAADGKQGKEKQNIAMAKTSHFYNSIIFNVNEHSRTTPCDFVFLLREIFNHRIADSESCKMTINLMGKQVNKSRIASGFDDKTSVFAKSGSLFRYIRNEVAIVKTNNEDFAIAIFTRAKDREADGKAIDACIGKVASKVIEGLKR